MKMRLKKDIVIPAGAIFDDDSNTSQEVGDDVYTHVFGLTKDTFGAISYFLDGEEQESGSLKMDDELTDWFEEIE